MAAADSIQAAMIFLTAQPFIRKTGVVIVGHSAGGWGALALASRNLKQVKAIIAFAAGRGGRVNGRPNNYCAPMQLIDAARGFGMNARTPVLSLYAENDTVIGPDLARNISMTYRNAGGTMDYRALPAFGREGHALFEEGVDIWGPIAEEFLKKTP
jgi:dienelactone hydrolase